MTAKDKHVKFLRLYAEASPTAPGLSYYLAARLGVDNFIELAAATGLPELRLHPALDYWHEGRVIGVFPALLALAHGISGDVRALHRTCLSPDCKGKAALPEGAPAKKLLSAWEGAAKGAAVQLYPAGGPRLAVAEGIETALAVRCAVPDLPVWAAISAGGPGGAGNT